MQRFNIKKNRYSNKVKGVAGIEPTKVDVSDISPFSLPITVMDRSRKPISVVDFEIQVNGENTEKCSTDKDGILKIKKPKSSVKVILTGEVDV